MTAAKSALESAKQLQGVLVRLAERRERQVSRATGEFQLDLLAFISDKPDELIEMVRRGLALDHSQPYLQLALSEAIAQKREQNESDGEVLGRRRDFSYESERPTEPAQLNPMPSPPHELGESSLLQAGAFDVPVTEYPVQLPGERLPSPAVRRVPGTVVELTGAEAAEAMRGSPPPRFEVRFAEDAAEPLPPLPDSAYPPGAVELPELGEYRYPEPGEPATVLPDGSVVALDSGTLDGGPP